MITVWSFHSQLQLSCQQIYFEIHSNISLDRFLPFPLSIDFDFYLLATQVFDYTRNYTDFIGTSLLFAWNKFSIFNKQMNRYIFRYKSMKSVKIKINR